MYSIIPISDFKKEILYRVKKKKRLGVYIKMLTVVVFIYFSFFFLTVVVFRWWVRWVIFIFFLILTCIYPSF